MVLTLQERIFIVENVLRKGGKYTKEVQELFQEKFGAERLPHRNFVSALLHKFKEIGSVQANPKLAVQKSLQIRMNLNLSVFFKTRSVALGYVCR